jgi:hypothetical protein
MIVSVVTRIMSWFGFKRCEACKMFGFIHFVPKDYEP